MKTVGNTKAFVRHILHPLDKAVRVMEGRKVTFRRCHSLAGDRACEGEKCLGVGRPCSTANEFGKLEIFLICFKI